MCTGSGRCLIIAMLMASVLRRAARPTPCNHAYSSTAPLVPGETRPTTPRSPHWDPRLFGEAPSPGPTRRREAPSACSHWEAAPLPCARHYTHFLWGTFLDACSVKYF